MDRNMILIADDQEINREILKAMFEEQYGILQAADGFEAIERIKKHHRQIALIFLDMLMPGKPGMEVLAFMTGRGYTDVIPVIMITEDSTDDMNEKAYEYGVADIIYKPFASKVVMRRAMNMIELYAHRADIEQKLKMRTRQLVESQKKLQRRNEFLITALSSVVEFRSLESGEHIQRVRYLTKIMLKYIRIYYPQYRLTKDRTDLIVNASALHDLGKIAISDSILLKNGKLTDEEFEEMKKHTIYGCQLLEQFREDGEVSEFYHFCYDICRYHHERYDGGGYPDHLKGDEIPIWAQAVSVVDVFDALVSRRVYKQPYAVEEAFRMIFEGECGVFSPVILDCLRLAKYDLKNAAEEKLSFADGEMVEREEADV
ncbi:MAG: response regulator [Eubacterium sp.]|jgi:response regulator RpfG family c-di-GMP phosphodiesterase|nr:response regulator [Eubacterium sp.]